MNESYYLNGTKADGGNCILPIICPEGNNNNN